MCESKPSQEQKENQEHVSVFPCQVLSKKISLKSENQSVILIAFPPNNLVDEATDYHWIFN